MIKTGPCIIDKISPSIIDQIKPLITNKTESVLFTFEGMNYGKLTMCTFEVSPKQILAK